MDGPLISIPTTTIDGKEWFLLKSVDEVFIFRAVSIEFKGRVAEKSGHRVDEARAKGSVKCRPRCARILL